MSLSNKQVCYRWFEEIWNQGREEVIDELFAADGIAHGLADEDGNPIIGPAGFKPFFRNFKSSFPDMKITIEDIIEEGEKVALRCVVTGKHAGNNLGIDATHRDVTFSGMAFLKMRNGQIAEAWNNFDFMGMFQQLDALRIAAKFK